MRTWLGSIVSACVLIASIGAPGYAQTSPSNGAPAVAPESQGSGHTGQIGIGVKVSTLGAGIEGAVRLTETTNVRAGFNMIQYSRGFDKDGVHYNGELNFRTLEAHLDYFPWARSFHLSPGVLVYAADPITATAVVPGNQSFSLGGVNYYSDPSSPVSGKGKITFYRAAPVITIGWGNLVSRKEGKHFTVPFEIGVAFQGTPQANLSLAGNVCSQPGINCRSVSDPIVQANIVSEQNKLNNNMSVFKAYPIISTGIGYKF